MDININNYLRINLVDMTMILISTALIVLIVKKFFWNIVKEYLEKRSAFIQSQLDEASTKNAESEKLQRQAQEELTSLKSQAKVILNTAEENAKKEAESIVNDAKTSATMIKTKAQSDIEQERRQVMQQMKEEMSEIALLAASKVVEKELNDDLHRKYVQEFIDEAGDESWQA